MEIAIFVAVFLYHSLSCNTLEIVESIRFCKMFKLPISGAVFYSLLSAYILSILIFSNKTQSTTLFEWRAQLNSICSNVKETNDSISSSGQKQEELNMVSTIKKQFDNKQMARSRLEHAISTERRIKTGTVNASDVFPTRWTNSSKEHK